MSTWENASTQSDRVKRSGGDIWVEACEGLGLAPGALILLRVPVYGLDDAPAEFWRTVDRYLKEALHFKAALLEPCWWSLCDETAT
eukprot:2727282-Alexandrium_andersonii.AAC.1